MIIHPFVVRFYAYVKCFAVHVYYSDKCSLAHTLRAQVTQTCSHRRLSRGHAAPYWLLLLAAALPLWIVVTDHCTDAFTETEAI